MSYLKYSNLCADMVRAALKESAKAKAKTREIIYYRSAVWKNGVPEKQGQCAWGGPRIAVPRAAWEGGVVLQMLLGLRCGRRAVLCGTADRAVLGGFHSSSLAICLGWVLGPHRVRNKHCPFLSGALLHAQGGWPRASCSISCVAVITDITEGTAGKLS
jgi:hypothetical protein